MRIYVASSNPGKLQDFAYAASAEGVAELMPLRGLKTILPPSEDEPTFEGNARAKALYYAKFAPGELVLADDSGLEVDALGGAPGVRSARYADDLGFESAGLGNADERNNRALLQALADASEDDRVGRYRCVLALARGNEIVVTAEGSLEGRIVREPLGTAGFGYDPLFFAPEAGATMAQASPELRMRLSHRGRALRRLLQALR